MNLTNKFTDAAFRLYERIYKLHPKLLGLQVGLIYVRIYDICRILHFVVCLLIASLTSLLSLFLSPENNYDYNYNDNYIGSNYNYNSFL